MPSGIFVHNFEAQLRSSAPTKCVFQGLCQPLARCTSGCAWRLLPAWSSRESSSHLLQGHLENCPPVLSAMGHTGAGFACLQPSFSCFRCNIGGETQARGSDTKGFKVHSEE